MTQQLQLTLDLNPRKQPARELPPMERLRAVLRRQGFGCGAPWENPVGSVLLRPMFGPHFGYQPMCGRYGCGDLVFERMAYREHMPDMTPEGRREHRDYLQVRRDAVRAYFGAPA